MKLAVFLAAALIAGPVLAGSLINKDSNSYDITINCGSGTSKMSISGGTTKSGILRSSASTCEVDVEGVGEIEVSGADDVVIKNGRLSKE